MSQNLNFQSWTDLLIAIKEYGTPVVAFGERKTSLRARFDRFTDDTLGNMDKRKNYNKFEITYKDLCSITGRLQPRLSNELKALERYRIIRRHKKNGMLNGVLILNNKFVNRLWLIVRELRKLRTELE